VVEEWQQRVGTFGPGNITGQKKTVDKIACPWIACLCVKRRFMVHRGEETAPLIPAFSHEGRREG